LSGRHVSSYIRSSSDPSGKHIQELSIFQCIWDPTIHNKPKPRGDIDISTSPRGLGILYKTLLARKLSKPEDGRVDDEISTSPRGLGILYKILLARKLSKLEDGRYRPKHVVFLLLINTII